MARVPARRTWLIGAAMVLQAIVIGTLVLAPPASTPSNAPLAMVAPPIVAAVVVEEINGIAGRPFDASISPDRATAEQSLRAGDVVAAVLVDLSTQHDTLLLVAPNGTGANDAIRDTLQAIGAPRGRTLTVEVLPLPGRHPVAPYALVLLGTLIGFTAAVIVTVRRGPVEASLRGGALRLRRFVLLAAVCAALAAVGGLAADVGALWLAAVTFLLVLIVALLTTALEAVLDVAGLAVATSLFMLTAAPLTRLIHPILQPEPWATLTPWLPHGAGLEIARSVTVFGGTGSARDWAVLLAYLGLAMATIATARRARTRAGVPVPPPLRPPRPDRGGSRR